MILELIAAGLLAAAPAHEPGSSLACAMRQIPEQAHRDFRADVLAGKIAKLPREVIVAIARACPIDPERSEAFGAAIASQELANLAADELVAQYGFTAAGIEAGWKTFSDAEKAVALDLLDKGAGTADQVTTVREAVAKFALAAQPALTRQSLDENQALARVALLYLLNRSYRDKVAPSF